MCYTSLWWCTSIQNYLLLILYVLCIYVHACVLVDEEEAAYMLLSVIMQNKFRQLSELLDSSYFSIDYQFGRGKRTLLHSAAR